MQLDSKWISNKNRTKHTTTNLVEVNRNNFNEHCKIVANDLIAKSKLQNIHMNLLTRMKQ